MITARCLHKLLLGGLSVLIAASLAPALASAQHLSDTATPTDSTRIDEITSTTNGDDPELAGPRSESSLDIDMMIAQSLKAVTINRDAAEKSGREAEKAIEKLNKALADLEAENRALTAIKADTSATDEDVAASENRVADAMASVEEAERAADGAAADAMGVDVTTVESMRDSGLGWLEICQEIGVSPSVLGDAVNNESKRGLIGKVLDTLFGSLKTTANSNVGKGKGNEKDKSSGNSKGISKWQQQG